MVELWSVALWAVFLSPKLKMLLPFDKQPRSPNFVQGYAWTSIGA